MGAFFFFYKNSSFKGQDIMIGLFDHSIILKENFNSKFSCEVQIFVITKKNAPTFR
jgi:hypothetical protein